MNKKLRQALAIIGLIFMVPFIVFLIMALGYAKVMSAALTGGLAGLFGCLVLIVFLLIKMDDARTKRMEARAQAVKDAIAAEEEAGNAAVFDEGSEDLVGLTDTASRKLSEQADKKE